MVVNLNRREIRRLIQALLLAEDYQYSSIDAYRTDLRDIKGIIVHCFPEDKEIRELVAKWKRDMRAFDKIRKKLKERIIRKVPT